MQAEYKRDMNHNYLVLHAEQEIDTSSYQVRMLVGNSVPSLLKCRVQGMDGSFLIYYETTSKQSLASLFEEKKLNYQDLKLVFGGFTKMLEEMSEYLLNPGRLLIRPEYMFTDVEKQTLYFCYFPDYEKDVRLQFQELTEYILPKIDHEDQKAVMLGYGVYRRAMESSFRMEYIKEELYRGGMEGKQKEANPDVNCGASVQGNQERIHSGPETANRETPEKPQVSEERTDWSEEEDLFFLHGEAGTEKKRAKGGERKILWKKPMACMAGTILVLGILLAKLRGYLPWIDLEYLLAGILAFAGIVILIFVVFCREKKARTLSALPQSVREKQDKDKNSQKEPEKKREEKTFGAEEDEKENNFKKEGDKNEMSSYENRKKIGWNGINGTDRERFGETMVLSAGGVKGPATLVSREPGELATIYLQEELTVIGKLENAADAVISYPTVSRVHAKIRCRDGEYYLADLNSRNGTAVNGKMLLPDQEYCLQDQDQVDFAQARYVFVK